jgi:hypothetical protein
MKPSVPDPNARLEKVANKLSWLWRLIDRLRYGKEKQTNQPKENRP